MGTIGDGTGSGYPGTIDSTETRSDGDIITANFQNDIQAVAQRYQTVLGLNPQGTFPSVVARLDALESRVFTTTTQRDLTAAINTPQILQADTITAGLMAATRKLTFEYFGRMTQTGSENTVYRFKIDTTTYLSYSIGTTQSDAPFYLQGTILMRDTLVAELHASLAIGTSADSRVQTQISQDLGQSFTLNFEMERDLLTATASLFGSVVQISG